MATGENCDENRTRSYVMEDRMMEHLEDLISTKFACFEEKLVKTQKNIADSQITTLQQDILCNDNYTFKRKSCEDQFKFNVKVTKTLKDADAKIKGLEMNEASKSIAEGLQLLHSRQKLIRIADSSDLGWSVVKEYQANPLASDSEDEKKIVRAESRANKKLKAKRSSTTSRRFGGRFVPYTSTSQTQQMKTGTSIPTINNGSVGRTNRPGLCFGCGKPGHWKFECRSDENKMYDKISRNFNSFDSVKSKYCSDTKDMQCSPIRASEIKIGMSDKNSSVESIYSVGNYTSVEGVSPVGRLKDCMSEWEKIDVDIYIKNVIHNGYKLPLKTLPGNCFLKNNKSAKDHPQFVAEEIFCLLEKGCISEVHEKPCVVNPLTVAVGKTGKLRLVLDCRHINPHLVKFRYKYEDVSTAAGLFQRADYLFTFDLKSAYHIIEIFEEHKKFLGFSWVNAKGNRMYYVFNVLPFGLATAGFIFSKLMRVPTRFIRSQGKKVVMFLDDGIGGHSSLECAKTLSFEVHSFLIKLGFLIAEKKCIWEPKQEAVWLGYIWKMLFGTLHATEERICRLENAIDSMFFQMRGDRVNVIPARFLASVIGQVVSLQNAIGKLVLFKTRSLYHCLDTRSSWNGYVLVDKNAIIELQFWKDNVRGLNAKRVKHNIGSI